MKRTMMATLALCIGLGTNVFAGDLTDPVEILKKVDAAAKAVKTVSYHARFGAEGAAAKQTPTMEGDVIFVAGEGDSMMPGKMCVDVKVKMPDSEEVRSIKVGSNGEDFYLIEHKDKTVYADMDPAVLGRGGQMAQALLMIEFIHPTPFSDEINAEKTELLGSVKIGDEDCYHIRVNYKNANNQVAEWYMSKKDFLPRRCDRISPMRDGNGTRHTHLILTKLDANPKIDDKTFTLTKPEGYTLSDDFAP